METRDRVNAFGKGLLGSSSNRTLELHSDTLCEELFFAFIVEVNKWVVGWILDNH